MGFRLISLVALLVCIGLVSCAPQLMPEIEFMNLPTGDNKVIALTFDDAPDDAGTITQQVLNQVKAEGVPATFFINSNNWTPLKTDTKAQNVVRNIVNSGYDLASHTDRHLDLAKLTSDQIQTEWQTTQDIVNNIFSSTGGYQLTLWRSPYGSPYQSGTAAQKQLVQSVVGQYAVHVGWAIDPQDYNCKSSQCVIDNVMSQVNAGHWGVILMHATYATTAQAIPELVQQLKAKGFRFVTVEDIVRSRYQGHDSKELYDIYRVQGKTVPAGYTPIPQGDTNPKVVSSSSSTAARLQQLISSSSSSTAPAPAPAKPSSTATPTPAAKSSSTASPSVSTPSSSTGANNIPPSAKESSTANIPKSTPSSSSAATIPKSTPSSSTAPTVPQSTPSSTAIPQSSTPSSTATPLTPRLLPELLYDDYPTSNRKLLAITLDDGPDGSGINTEKCFNQLKSLNISATFFINSNNWTPLADDKQAQAVIKSIATTPGFSLGSLTADHADLTKLNPTQIESQLTSLISTVDSFIPGQQIYLGRAPYGEPYLSGTQAQIDKVHSVFGQYHIQVGNSIQAQYSCKTSSCIVNSVVSKVKQGHWGIISLYATSAFTADAIPSMVAQLQAAGFEFVSVDRILEVRYGYNSAQLYDLYRNQGQTAKLLEPAALSNAAANTIVRSSYTFAIALIASIVLLFSLF